MKFRQEGDGESVARGGGGKSREFRRKKYFACKALVRNFVCNNKKKDSSRPLFLYRMLWICISVFGFSPSCL